MFQFPEVEEELVEASKVFSQDRDHQRSAEETIEIPVISLAEIVVEVPVIQTRGKDATGCEHSYPIRCRHSRSGESHQSGKDQPDDQAHRCSTYAVEKMGETLAIASRIPAILKFNTETGGDPFVKGEEFDQGIDQPIAGHIGAAEQESSDGER